MDIIRLDGGVDIAHAPSDTPAGKLRECFNYEVGWTRGYARVDGFERFDGQTSPSSTTCWVISTDDAHITGTFAAPELLTWSTPLQSGDAGTLVRVETEGTTQRLFVVFRTARKRPPFGATITGDTSDASFVLDDTNVTYDTLETYAATHDDYLNNLEANEAVLRDLVRPVPGGGTIVGLHWHEDRLYAVRDVQTVSLSEADMTKISTGMYLYNSAGQVGQVVESDEDSNTLEISPVTAAGFSASASDVLSIALQLRYSDGTAPEFEIGEAVAVPAVGSYEVGFVDVRASDWGSGTGQGDLILINGPDGQPNDLDVLTGAEGGSCVVASVYLAHRAGEITVTDSQDQSRVATLWKSSDDGWEQADVSRVLRFVNGETDPFTTVPVRVNQELTLGRAGAAGSGPVTGWFAQPPGVSDPSVADLTAAMQTDDAGYGRATITGQLYPGGPLVGLSGPCILGEWQLVGGPLASTATVKAVSVGFRIRATDPNAKLQVSRTGGGSPTREFVIPTTEAMVWVGENGAGNPTETWNKNWTPNNINQGNFSFRLGGSYAVGGGASTQFSVDEVRAKVRYDLLPGSTLYLWSGSEDLGEIQLTEAVLESGSWDDDDAEGFFVLEDWDIITMPAGTALYTAPGGPTGGGLLIAETASDVIPVNLPGSVALDEERARYQFISYNFYATEERNAIYGCSGAGPAFMYEPRTNKLQFISTGVEDDKPRHVAHHLSRLALGYSWGEVYVSAPGEPTNFNGVDFAASFGFGDKITGLAPTVGDATAVFTESSAWMMVGANGDDSNPPRQQVVNSAVGAIEYTVKSSGNRPMFASFRGVETLETTEQFGEFFTTPLTYDISPWLLERLQTAAGLEATDKSVVNSVVVRNKNQYRLFFADGYVSTLTLVGPDKEPQNTQQYYYFESNIAKPARVFATASGVTKEGRDRAFISTETSVSIPNAVLPEVYEENPDQPSTEDVTDYVYELDRGRNFDGGDIKAFFTLFYVFGQDQAATMATARYNVIHFHGRGVGSARLKISRAVNYEDIDMPPQGYEDAGFGALSYPPESEQKAKYTKARLSCRGFAVSIRVESETNREFPHVLQQVTLLDSEPKKLNR